MLRSVWLWPVVATLACTVYGIRTPVMWEDELTSWDVASRDLGQLLDTVQRVDAVLGTYYLLLHGWMTVFGDSATSLRLPSALAMAGAAGCAALCGQRLFGRRAGLAGGLLFALIPVVSRYAHEARPTHWSSVPSRCPRCCCCGRWTGRGADGAGPHTPWVWRRSACSICWH